jgi:dTDP-glucose pyrophosphorylase
MIQGLPPWFAPGVKCVVLAAGKGTRAYPATLQMPKVILPIGGRPALSYVVDFWKQYTTDFIFVVGYKQEMVVDCVSQLSVRSQFVEQKELRGIAHALLQARELVSQRFILVLGDCFFRGTFEMPPDMEQGVGVWTTDNADAIRRSYSLELDAATGCVSRVVEKPTQLVNNLCGMGFYFFDSRIFDAIERTPPSALRNEIEITDAIGTMISSGHRVSPVTFNGEYLNITFEDDVRRIAVLGQ